MELIEFAEEQCKIFPEDSEMGMFLRETLKILQESPCEDVPDTNVGNKADGMTKEPTAYRRYRDLLEYFGNDSILEDDEEFKKWLERIKWHVRKANELYQKYECQKEHCEDAVSRTELKKWLDMNFSFGGAARKLEFFDRLDKELPPVTPTKRWIPVSERLPKPYTFVNATCRSLVDDRENWVVETIYLPIPKEVNEQGYSDWGNIPMLNWGKAEVIAWMQRDIPEPYQAEK